MTRKKTPKKAMSAAELVAKLNSDPEFVAKRKREEAEREARAAEWTRAEAPLVDELNAAGFAVESAWDLANMSDLYPDALPILVKHLQRPYPERVREGIARALAVPDAIKEWDTLLRLFESETTTDVKWALGCALAAAATEDVVDDMIRLLRNRKHGGHRTALISGLARSADPRARSALIDAGADSELATEAQKALKHLGKKKAQGARLDDSTAKELPSGLSEVSTNFDSDHVEPFLKRVSRLVSGFGKREITEVTQLLDELEVDDERELRFEVRYEGRLVPLQIGVFMDDIDSPDLYFFTTPNLAAELGTLMQDFSEEQEM